ncbi:MAG: PAS domain-containing protein [Holophaga sp.]|nr:PAS domain-containing protein [Holophaga sp.]
MTARSSVPGKAAALRWRAEELAQSRPEERKPLTLQDLQTTLHELRVHQIELEMQNEELLRVQDKLEEARARYFDLYDLAPVGYLILSPEGLILEANQTAVTLLGAARATLVRQPITRFILSQDQDSYYLYRKQLHRSAAALGCDLRLAKPDGTLLWVHVASGCEPASLNPPGSRVVLVDITERKRIEATLQRSEALLRETQELGRIGSWEWDVRSQVLSWSRQIYRLHQLSPGGPLPRPEAQAQCRECYLPEDRDALDAALVRCVEEAQAYDLACRITTAKGRPVWIRTCAEPVLEDGKVVRVLGFSLDVGAPGPARKPAKRPVRKGF